MVTNFKEMEERSYMPKSLLSARGSGAIPMTPFTEDDRIDVDVLEQEIEFIVESKAGLICTPLMVSEFMSLSEEERRLMIRVPIEVAKGRTLVLANVAACNTPTAVAYAEYAQKMGADAVIAMAPWAGGGDAVNIVEYFTAIAKAVDLPVMIQNAGIPGVQQSPQQIMELCEKVPNISWVKEEVPPGPISISNLMAVKTDALEGVMSGFGGIFNPLDFARGATATIHACEYCDVIQKIWDLFFEGKEDEGRDLHYKLLPAIQLESLFGMRYAKEIMIRRGVFKNRKVRNLGKDLTAEDLREIDKVWERVEPLLIWKKH